MTHLGKYRKCKCFFISFGLFSDIIGSHRTWSTLVQVMWLVAPSHNLNQCWPFSIQLKAISLEFYTIYSVDIHTAIFWFASLCLCQSAVFCRCMSCIYQYHSGLLDFQWGNRKILPGLVGKISLYRAERKHDRVWSMCIFLRDAFIYKLLASIKYRQSVQNKS